MRVEASRSRGPPLSILTQDFWRNHQNPQLSRGFSNYCCEAEGVTTMKYTGRGGVLAVRTIVSPATWQDFAQVRSIGGISMTSDEIESTTLDNVGSFREFLQGFRDAGEMALELVFDPNLESHGPGTFGAYGLFSTGLNIVLRETLPVSPLHYVHLQGFFRDFELPTLTTDDVISVTTVLRLSGTPILSTSGVSPY